MANVKTLPDMKKIAIWTTLFIGALAMIMPLIFMFSTSLKIGEEVYSLSLWPSDPTLENYTYLFENSNFIIWFMNSFIVAIGVTLSVLFFDSLVGYTLCKFNFKGKKIIFVAILSTMMIPTEMLVIPWYIMSKDLGWLDSYWGIMFPGMMSGFGVFLMKQFFETVPDDYIHAARIDGLNEFAIWWKVAMPMVSPALSALAIFTFLGNWTAFLWPMIVSNDTNLYTVPVGLASFTGEFITDWELIMAGASIATIPTLIVFLLLQKYIVQGVVMAGLKG